MASYYAPDFYGKNTRVPEGGNAYNDTFSYTHPVGGIVAASKVYYGVIPAGVEISGVKKTNDANTAGYTESLGYEPVDSTNGPVAAPTYWLSAAAAVAAGVNTSLAHPIVFDYPVFIVGLTGGATSTAASKSSVTVNGRIVGCK